MRLGAVPPFLISTLKYGIARSGSVYEVWRIIRNSQGEVLGASLYLAFPSLPLAVRFLCERHHGKRKR